MVVALAVLNNPYAIFANARAYWESAAYPVQVSYTIAVHVQRNGSASSATYHAYYDSRQDRVRVNAVSDEEIAHPYTPRGINVIFSPFGGSIPLSSPQQTFDYLGVPLLAPNYTFGIAPYVPPDDATNSMRLVNEIRREFHDPAHQRASAQTTGLKTIASIEVAKRNYVITLAGIVGLNGHADYDLLLRPITNPGKYRLREAWIDENTFATDKIVTQGNFTAPALGGIPWTVVFRQVDGTPYIASEVTHNGFVLDRRPYDSAEVDFTDLQSHRIPAYAGLYAFATNPETGVAPLVEP